MSDTIKITGYKDHKFHLVDPSPWPLLSSFAVFFAATGGVLAMHNNSFGKLILFSGLALVFYVAYAWWKDIIKEGKVDKAHTSPVQTGLRMGMLLFILSEVMFFFAFFFSFFHSSILPIDIFDGLWPIAEGISPPEGTKTIDPWSIPFMNTLILLLSGTTVTWAHYALLNGNNRDVVKALTITVSLGLIFTGFQIYEYSHVLHHNFGFDDNVYSSNFYMATGFHGFHVLIGTIFLFVCLLRAKKGDLTQKGHLGFEFAAWYWHFVDVVWIFLFFAVYVWGS